MHILATRMVGISLEGSLKIREVVLNHTQGYEASEFKHGPNTILGVNTVFGIDAVRQILKKFSDAVLESVEGPSGKFVGAKSVHKIFRAVSDYAFDDIFPESLNKDEMDVFEEIFKNHNFFESMYRNYPLIFLSGPSKRDQNLTISQINTHKIRGANVYVIAEESPGLKQAAINVPSTRHKYKSGYIKLPKTGDDLLPAFSSTVVLQLLAYKMSVKKCGLLNRLEIENHGVNPDSPKNVSKSITVD